MRLPAFRFGFGPSKQSAYDLQAPASNGSNGPDTGVATDNDCKSNEGDREAQCSVYGISINSNDNLNSYVPNSNATKSLATDLIQLTRFKNRRPTIADERMQRRSSFKNIFLGIPELGRRFSQDIRGANLEAKCQALKSKETKRVLLLQVFVPFLLSGFGNVAAGLFLNHAQTWKVFRDSTVFYMLLATVMAFKTNLEATLAARLSTCSNMGSIKTWSKRLEAFLGNLALVQTQSIIFGLMSSCLVVLIDILVNERFDFSLSLRVISTSLAAICVNELLSSCLILSVVIASERAGVNPDNVSTLIAAMFGDFSSVFFISITASFFHGLQEPSQQWYFVAIILGIVACLPLAIYLATQNSFTQGMFIGTHLPLALAVTVATISGLVFDHAVRSFARIAIYQAVVNGVSVNLMAVQASRISTYLQQLNSVAPHRARSYASKCSPFGALYAQDMNASVARWLIAMCVPAMTVYLCFIFLVCPKYVHVTFYLTACCLIAILAQVTLMQCLTYLVTPISWRFDWDSDNVVIPVLMSISDCSGNAFLLMAFIFLRKMADPNSVGHSQASLGLNE